MTFGKFGAPVALCLILATPVSADITPQEAWDQMKPMLTLDPANDVSVGSISTDNSNIVVTDISSEIDVEGAVISYRFPSIDFTDVGNGSVRVTYGQPAIIQIAGAQKDDAPSVTLEMTHKDLDIVISGDVGASQYDVKGDWLQIDIADFSIPGETGSVTGHYTLNGIASTYQNTEAAIRKIAGAVSVNEALIDINFEFPSDGLKGAVTGQIADILNDFSVDLPLDIKEMDADNPFASGLSMGLNQSFGAIDYGVDITSADGPVSVMVAADGGQGSVQMDAQEVSYGASAQNLSYSGVLPGPLPLPVGISMKELGFNASVPLSDEMPGKLAVGISLKDLVLNDLIWGMIDPVGQLPHDPATIIVDVEGSAKWLLDIFDPTDQEAMEQLDMPLEFYDLNVRDIKLSALGAEIKSAGQFSFDNSNLETFGGLPAPEGKLSIAGSGINGLLDNLISMGLLAQDDAMMPRMMFGMFTNAGPTEDSFTTELEVTGNGGVLLNGQRMR